MKPHKLKVVAEDGRLRRVELDGLPLCVAVDGLEIRFPEDGLPVVRITPVVTELELEADAVSLEALEAVVWPRDGDTVLRVRECDDNGGESDDG